ncbi:hypothetical protein MMC30_006351 [Trapelia coarctata]|nr:hypothetical protein [Trapelia coarctata]
MALPFPTSLWPFARAETVNEKHSTAEVHETPSANSHMDTGNGQTVTPEDREPAWRREANTFERSHNQTIDILNKLIAESGIEPLQLSHIHWEDSAHGNQTPGLKRIEEMIASEQLREVKTPYTEGLSSAFKALTVAGMQHEEQLREVRSRYTEGLSSAIELLYLAHMQHDDDMATSSFNHNKQVADLEARKPNLECRKRSALHKEG